jgi:hypothetical protein
MTKTMDWPASVPDRTKLVRYYIMEEGWTYLQLAQAFGVSRSAIAGVCYRAGIRKLKAATKKTVVGPGLPPQHLSTRLTAAQEAPVDIMAKRPIEGDVWSPLPGIDAIAFTDTTAGQCKWMVGHHLCCGAQATRDKPYCPTHCAIAYKDPPPPLLKPRGNSQTSTFKVGL